MSKISGLKRQRSNLDIAAEILDVAKGGVKKTHIMYRANLSYNLLEDYLNHLVSNGLLLKRNGIYFTSRKGARFLECYGVAMKTAGFSSKLTEGLRKRGTDLIEKYRTQKR